MMNISDTRSLSPRCSLWFAGLFLALMLACIFAPRAQSFLPGLLGTGTFIFFLIRNRQWPSIDRGLLLFCLLTGGLCALSGFWAQDGSYVVERALKQTGILLSGFAIVTMAASVSAMPARDTLVRVAALSCALIAASFFFESYGGFTIARILMAVDPNVDPPESIRSGFLLNRGTVFLILFSIPVLLALYGSGLERKRKIFHAVLMGAGTGALLYATESQTAQMAALTALLMMLWPSHKKFARRLVLIVVVAAIFIVPFLPCPAYKAFIETDVSKKTTGLIFKASIPHRLEVWNFVGEEIAKKPFFGHGMEAVRTMKSSAPMPNMKTDHVLHPHNAILQAWVEFGLLGGLLSAALVIFLFLKLERLPPVLQRYYTALFSTLFVVLCTGYGLWQSWQLGFVFSIPAFSMMVTRLYPETFGIRANA